MCDFVSSQLVTFNAATKLGPRRHISEDGLKLTLEKLCKDCSGEGAHTTDLMNVQCMATNKHNYSFADAYLNVLSKFREILECLLKKQQPPKNIKVRC